MVGRLSALFVEVCVWATQCGREILEKRCLLVELHTARMCGESGQEIFANKWFDCKNYVFSKRLDDGACKKHASWTHFHV